MGNVTAYERTHGQTMTVQTSSLFAFSYFLLSSAIKLNDCFDCPVVFLPLKYTTSFAFHKTKKSVFEEMLTSSSAAESILTTPLF